MFAIPDEKWKKKLDKERRTIHIITNEKTGEECLIRYYKRKVEVYKKLNRKPKHGEQYGVGEDGIRYPIKKLGYIDDIPESWEHLELLLTYMKDADE